MKLVKAKVTSRAELSSTVDCRAAIMPPYLE